MRNDDRFLVIKGSAYLYCTGIPSKLEICFLLLFIDIFVTVLKYLRFKHSHSVCQFCVHSFVFMQIFAVFFFNDDLF